MSKKEVFFKQSAEILKSIYLARKDRNPKYSARAFARDLELSQSLVSLIMNGKRNLTLAQAIKIATLLENSKSGLEEAEKILVQTIKTLPGGGRLLQNRDGDNLIAKEISYREIEIEKLKVISEWFHLPILDLATTCDFKSDPVWIASRLGISKDDATAAMDRLVTVGLAKIENDVFKKVTSKIDFNTEKSESFVRSYHSQMISLAKSQLELADQKSFEARDISGITFAVSKNKISVAKKKIAHFQKELANLLSDGNECHEVYQLNIQLFPLTKN